MRRRHRAERKGWSPVNDTAHRAPKPSFRPFASALSAFTLWGLLPLYWKLLASVPAAEVLAHRIVWTSVLTVAVLAISGQISEFFRVFRSPVQLRAGIAASILISGNGLTFIWAVANDRVTEISLGYYINPLLNMLLGFVVLGERPNRLQSMAIGLAGVGVAYLTVSAGQLPWPAFVLAGCFSLYGLVRKTAPIAPLVGLAAEMSLAAPVAMLYLAWVPATAFGAFVVSGLELKSLLILSGVATALPLWMFSVGARRLTYTTIGVLMFLAPSLQLAVAVLVYGEPFHLTQAVTFAFIWSAIALYLYGTLRVTSDSR